MPTARWDPDGDGCPDGYFDEDSGPAWMETGEFEVIEERPDDGLVHALVNSEKTRHGTVYVMACGLTLAHVAVVSWWPGASVTCLACLAERDHG